MRNFLIHTLGLVHIFTRVSLFIGMLTVAGLSLFALTPVAYEDYQAYLAQSESTQNPSSANYQQTSGRVAGESEAVSANSDLVEVELRGLEYGLEIKDKQDTKIINFSTEIPIEDFLRSDGTKELINLKNTGLTPKLYELQLIGEVNYKVVDTASRFEPISTEGFIELDPGDQVFLVADISDQYSPESFPVLNLGSEPNTSSGSSSTQSQINSNLRINFTIREIADIGNSDYLTELP
jgi:hypothetical protein